MSEAYQRRHSLADQSAAAKYARLMDRQRQRAPLATPADHPLIFIEDIARIFGDDVPTWTRLALGVCGPDMSHPRKSPAFGHLVQCRYHLAVPLAVLTEWLEQHGTPAQLAILARQGHTSERRMALTQKSNQVKRAASRTPKTGPRNPDVRQARGDVADWSKSSAPTRPITSVFDLGLPE